MPAEVSAAEPTVVVPIGELAVLRGQGLLMAIGLGSCVGVGLYDPVARVAGLAHVFLPTSRDGVAQRQSPARFADRGVAALVEAMRAHGAVPRRLVAKLAGGAQLFLRAEATGLDIGRRNVEAVLKALREMGVPVVGQDTGGHHGRTMKLHVSSGRVQVCSMGQPVKEL